jgi:hypothetical protein
VCQLLHPHHLFLAHPASAVKQAPKSSVTQTCTANTAVGMTPIGHVDKPVKQPAMPVKAAGPRCISVKPVTPTAVVNAAAGTYEGPVITELYASLRLERDTAKQQQASNADAGRKASRDQGRINSAGQQTGTAN